MGFEAHCLQFYGLELHGPTDSIALFCTGSIQRVLCRSFLKNIAYGVHELMNKMPMELIKGMGNS